DLLALEVRALGVPVDAVLVQLGAEPGTDAVEDLQGLRVREDRPAPGALSIFWAGLENRHGKAVGAQRESCGQADRTGADDEDGVVMRGGRGISAHARH